MQSRTIERLLKETHSYPSMPYHRSRCMHLNAGTLIPWFKAARLPSRGFWWLKIAWLQLNWLIMAVPYSQSLTFLIWWGRWSRLPASPLLLRVNYPVTTKEKLFRLMASTQSWKTQLQMFSFIFSSFKSVSISYTFFSSKSKLYNTQNAIAMLNFQKSSSVH